MDMDPLIDSVSPVYVQRRIDDKWAKVLVSKPRNAFGVPDVEYFNLDTAYGMSVNLLGGDDQFKAEFVDWVQGKPGCDKWQSGEIDFDKEKDCATHHPGTLSIYVNVNEAHRHPFPYKREIKDKNQLKIYKDVILVMDEADLEEAEKDKSEGRPPLTKVQGTIIVDHKPTNFNYWHCEIYVEHYPDKKDPTKRARVKKRRNDSDELAIRGMVQALCDFSSLDAPEPIARIPEPHYMTAPRPAITVVIPLYNKRERIGDTLRSVLAQTWRDFEIVVVDDGSTDGSPDIVRTIAESQNAAKAPADKAPADKAPAEEGSRAPRPAAPQIRLITQPNAGVSAARNRGIAEARGQYIAFLDADDVWLPEYLETITALVKDFSDCAVFATDYWFLNLDGSKRTPTLRDIPFEGERGELTGYFHVAAHSEPPLWASAVVVRKDAIESVGGFPVGIKSGEDMITWARLAFSYRIAYCKRPLAVFKESPANPGEGSKVKARLGGEDYVLNGLLSLYNETEDPDLKSQLREYVLRWYKIYCVILIECTLCHRALPLAARAMRFGGSAKTFMPIMAFGLLPSSAARSLFYRLRHLRR